MPQPPSPGTDAHFPLFMLVKDSHSFQLCTWGFSELCLNQSLLCGLPERAAMSFRPHSLGMAASGPKTGSPRVPPTSFALVGVKMGDRRGVGGGPPGVPQCLLRSPRWGWERGLYRGSGAKREAAAWRSPQEYLPPLRRV